MSDDTTQPSPLAPGAISAFKTWKAEREQEIEYAQDALWQQLIAAAPESMRKLLRSDRGILRTLLKAGSSVQRYGKNRWDLEEGSFRSIAQLKEGFEALRAAWSPYVRITINNETNRLTVNYQAL